MPIWIDCEGCGTNQPTYLPAYPPGTFENAPPAAPAPTVTGLIPSSIDYGSSAIYLEVMGTGFNGSSRILLDGVAVPTEYLSQTRLRTLLQPALVTAATPVTVTVHNGSVAATGAPTFNYTAPPAPVVEPHITDVNPTGMETDDPDTTVHIMGTNFTDTTEVYVNGTPVETTHVSDTELTYVAKGDSVGAHTVTVGVPTMRSGSAVFTVVPPPAPVAPVLTSMTPNSVGRTDPATTVTIVGTGFTPECVVLCGSKSSGDYGGVYVDAQTMTFVVAPQTDTFLLPSNNITVRIGSTGKPQSNVLALLITEAAVVAPTITSLSPATCVSGVSTPVRIIGTGFTPETTMKISGTVTPVTFVSDTELSYTTPAAHEGLFPISVYNGTTASNSKYFTVTAIPAPTLTAIDPATAVAGSGDFTVTATGANYYENCVIMSVGIEKPTTYVNETTLTTVVTALTNPGGSMSILVKNKDTNGQSPALSISFT